MPPTARRLLLLTIVTALGFGSRAHPLGFYFWDKTLADAAYAVAVYLVLAILFPRRRPILLAITALLICIAIEFFKLTGLPARWDSSALSRVLFGTTFAWINMATYAVAILVIIAVDRGNS